MPLLLLLEAGWDRPHGRNGSSLRGRPSGEKGFPFFSRRICVAGMTFCFVQRRMEM